jgi:ankyrin repeat protein
MFKAVLSFCILFFASILLAAQPASASLQERFDKLAGQKTFGEAEVAELRAIMEEAPLPKTKDAKTEEEDGETEEEDETAKVPETEEDAGKKVDCTFCPDAFIWHLVSNGFFEEANWLFSHHADFGIKDQNGMTLLHMACRGGHLDFAKGLINRGAEINLPDNDGLTAIHYAAMSGNSELMEELLRRGSDPNKLTKKMDTPLHFAARYAGLEEVKFLIEHGASIKTINWKLLENLKDQRRRQDNIYNNPEEERIATLKNAIGLKTPDAMLTDEEEDEEEDRFPVKKNEPPAILDLDKIPYDLLPRDPGDAANVEGMTALHYAAAKGDTELVKYLVEQGADINAQDTVLSRSAIHFAAENGSLECIRFLTENGADLLDRDSFGATPLHYAARSNKLDVLKFLVDRKVDYTAKDIRGWSAMHYAASGGSIDIVKYLLAKGLNINELNESGRTPLFLAKKHSELKKFMISKGAR